MLDPISVFTLTFFVVTTWGILISVISHIAENPDFFEEEEEKVYS